jgi:hypothetical protein
MDPTFVGSRRFFRGNRHGLGVGALRLQGDCDGRRIAPGGLGWTAASAFARRRVSAK